MLDGSDTLIAQRHQIPLQARVLAVADVYDDALTASDRPYKKSASPEKAMAILTEKP
jgi:HD-GYP domain-containing protein (c-di-GMP phosphodiesterase class II)